MRSLLSLVLPLVALAGDLRFRGAGEFDFDTGVLSGKLREGGKSIGARPVVCAGVTLTRSMGWFGHYRVFTANHRFGPGAWYWESESRLLDDGAVETRWPPSSERPFEMAAVYRWTDPSTLDLETSVRALAELRDFEVFLAAYFAPQFTSSQVYAGGRFVPAEQSAGVWQVFPRDEKALALVRDGRWAIPPDPVDWVPRPALTYPLAVRRDPATGLTVAIMAAPEDCFAVYTPHQTEGHYSLYFSLFGRTLKVGETARARSRLVVGSALSEEQAVKLYRVFVRQVSERGRKARNGTIRSHAFE